MANSIELGGPPSEAATSAGEVIGRGPWAVDLDGEVPVRSGAGCGFLLRCVDASLIAWAVAEGREFARRVDEALRGERSALPTRGVELAF